ncbi:hypothetical protein [Synechococcus sp. CC9616]|uniref:hypothetical protein n=1 Tax=Synechococcus sp. CC9616 TaxID=110663 RepID=UPI0012EC78E3|nr:hypothetical protein [Synechococcus sp. CC9616]
MKCLKKNGYDLQVLSYNIRYTFKEIEKISQPDICFIGKMRHDKTTENGDQFCQFHLNVVLNIKRKGAKIACMYSDNICEYADQGGEMYKNLLYLSDLVITPSKKMKEHALKRVASQTRVITITDPQLFEEQPFKRLLPNQICRLIWFGNDKNIEYLQDILPPLTKNSNANMNYVLTVLASTNALNAFKYQMTKSLPQSKHWTLRFVPWDANRQPEQLVKELGNSHISLIPSNPKDPLKNGVSHNRLTDSIQHGCISIASPMDSYMELNKVCLIGKDFSLLLQKAVQENKRLCRKYEILRPAFLERFKPENNLLSWTKALEMLEKGFY